jgi:hypothetical protein
MSSNRELPIPFLRRNVFTRRWPRKVSESEIPNIKPSKQLKHPASAAPFWYGIQEKKRSRER